MAKEKNKNDKWVKPRHRIFSALVKFFSAPVFRLKYGYKPYSVTDISKRPHLILFSHRTVKDQFLVSLAFNRQIYFVANEDLFSTKLSPFLLKMTAPIPYKKMTHDLKSIMLCKKVASEGGSIAISPEGHISYDGRACYIKPSIAKFVKMMNMPVALFVTDGGYGAFPRWGDKRRKGKITGGVKEIIEPEEYKNISNEELYSRIVSALSWDESKSGGTFKSKTRAMYLERLIYVCPKCGISSFTSEGDKLTCNKCFMTVSYGEDKRFSDAPFKTVAEWYDFQNDFIKSMDLESLSTDEVIFSDTQPLFKVDGLNREKITDSAKFEMFKDRLEIGGESYRFDDISVMTVIEANTLDIYLDEKRKLQILPTDKRFNAVKYVNVFYHYKFSKEKGEQNEFEFLGL